MAILSFVDPNNGPVDPVELEQQLKKTQQKPPGEEYIGNKYYSHFFGLVFM